MKLFVAFVNADSTEGKGPMIPVGYFDNEDGAVDFIKGKGVMGYGDGEVRCYRVYTNVSKSDKLMDSTVIYGYHRQWDGTYGYGYLDNRDAPSNDPEYAEFQRLLKKFGGLTVVKQ